MAESIQQKARELGVTRRTLQNWINNGCDCHNLTVTEIRRWAADQGKRGFVAYAGDSEGSADPENRAYWELRYKKSQTLLNESKIQQEKEKYLAEKRDVLIEECERFLGLLANEVAKLDLPRKDAERLNKAIAECLENCERA